MDDQPVEALRHKRNSSIAVMAQYAAQKKVDVAISAGNTGAYVAAWQMHLKLLPGVLRSGILVVFPTFEGPVILCDVGANIAPKPAHLYQYALMSCIYAREVEGIANPRVGLVSIGQEDAKGNELIKKTNQLLRDDNRIRFVGNIETRVFLGRPADVVICDGFVGNVILKLTEGLADGLFKAIKKEIQNHSPEILKHFEPVIERLYAKHDYNEYGGAPLMGVNGTCLICHGSSDSRAIKNAITRSRHQATLNINQKIIEEVQKAAIC
jgi:glycerol-3-phosphate acyltransferase PlsX